MPLGFSVMGSRTLWWGGCAWDSFAVPHLVEEEVLVATRCPGCERALAWNVGTDQPPKGRAAVDRSAVHPGPGDLARRLNLEGLS